MLYFIDMPKNKDHLIIDLAFAPVDTQNYIDLPQIKLQAKSANAFLILDPGSTLMNEGFKHLILSKNCIKTLNFTDENTLFTHESIQNKPINKAISFYNLEFLNNESKMAPIAQEYWHIKKNYVLDKNRIKNISTMMLNNEFKIKYNTLAAFKENINIIYSELADFKREHEYLFKALNTSIENSNISEAELNTVKLIDNYEWFSEKIVYEFLELFERIFNFAKNLLRNYHASDDFNTLAKTESLRRRIEYVTLMQKTSKEMVKRQIYLRDLHTELNESIKLKDRYRSNTQNKLNNVINWYRKGIKLLNHKANFFPKHSLEQLQIYKSVLIYKYIIKLLFLNKNKLKGLSVENIAELKVDLDSRSSLFIANNLAKNSLSGEALNLKGIKKTIRKELYLEIDQYIELSRSNTEILNEHIKYLKNRIKKVKTKSLNVFGIENYHSDINKLKSKITLTQAELNWQQDNVRNEFKNESAISNQFNINAKRIIKTYSALLNFNLIEFNKLSHSIANIGSHDQEIFKKLINIKNQIDTVCNLLSSIEFLFNYIELIRSLLFNKYDLSHKNIEQIDIFFKLMQVLNNVSFSASSLTKPINNLSNISRLKIGLVSELMNGAKVCFINDDINNCDSRLKNEFLRIANDFCSKQEITYTFITNDIDLVRDNSFDNLYVFCDNKLIEYGASYKVLNNPLHPLLKEFLSKGHVENSEKFTGANYIFTEDFEFSDNHNIVASNTLVKNLSADNLSEIQTETFDDLETTTIYDLQSYGNNEDTMIVNLDTQNIDTIDLEHSQQLTLELHALNSEQESAQTDTIFIAHDDAY
ncbi:MAG1360 family OppF-related protein [Mycoplasma simbae]|uniref:MAG1360 family OppF-related protein n=1 Tax=Mycoplasma simbae TaxID=36744 RepID=UPI000495F952|nr:hypothetical protein [Mycoplasma simbae]